MNHERLKRLRKLQGLTQQELADKVDVTQPHYQRIEKGRGCMSLDLAQRLATALGVGLAELLEDDVTPDAELDMLVNRAKRLPPERLEMVKKMLAAAVAPAIGTICGAGAALAALVSQVSVHIRYSPRAFGGFATSERKITHTDSGLPVCRFSEISQFEENRLTSKYSTLTRRCGHGGDGGGLPRAPNSEGSFALHDQESTRVNPHFRAVAN